MARCIDSDAANQELRAYEVVRLISGLWNKLDMRTSMPMDGLTDDDIIAALEEEYFT
jgi:hypothetical protein